MFGVDAKGNVRVWDIHNSKHIAKRVWDNMLPGKVKDITWAGDSQKLAVVGEGNIVYIIMRFGLICGVWKIWKAFECRYWSRTRGYYRPFKDATHRSFQAGEVLSSIIPCLNVSRRPYRLFTAGEDKTVNFYEGTPFKFKRTHNDV